MKRLLLAATLLSSSLLHAEDAQKMTFDSGVNKNHVLKTFQSENCKKKCSDFYRNLNIYSPQNVFVLRFDDKKFSDKHEYLSNINGARKVSPQHFLNYSILSTDFYNYVDLRNLKNHVVGNINVEFDNTQIKAIFNPMKTEKVEDNLYNRYKKIKTEKNIYNSDLDGESLHLFVAVTSPKKNEYMDDGDNEGHFLTKNHEVLFLDFQESDNFEWSIDIPYKTFDKDSLSFVVWIEDEEKNIIQAASAPFYRFSY